MPSARFRRAVSNKVGRSDSSKRITRMKLGVVNVTVNLSDALKAHEQSRAPVIVGRYVANDGILAAVMLPDEAEET